MLILAFESSAKPVSVAVCDGNSKLLGQYFQNNGFSHSRTLMSLAKALLKNLGIKPADIDRVAVASGPGSFTGVRIGVSAAKGFAWGLDIPVCGVSTLEAMAYQTSKPGVIICPVMDARRDQVYNALFEWRDGSLHRLYDDRAVSVDDLAADLRGFDLPCLLIGDGITVCKDSDAFSGFNYMIAPELLKSQTAYGVALASFNVDPVSSVELEPFYLRPSQAEREHGNKK